MTVVDDTYNASPRSVVAALDLLAGLPGRRVAVLGEMLELGEASDEGHRVVGEAAARTVDWLVVVGPVRRGIAEGAAAAGLADRDIIRVPDAETRPRRPACRASATATSCWSRRRAGSRLERVVDGLRRELGERAAAMTVELIQGLLLAFALMVILMSPYIRLLHALGFGKRIRQEGPESHYIKEGTPTMGGLLIVGVVIGIYFFLRPGPDASTFAPLAALAGVGALGAFDDYLNARTGEGIRVRQKLIWLTVVAVRRGLADPADLQHHRHRGAVRRRRSRSTRGCTSLFATFAIVAAANGVNITDGLDGLSGGTLAIAFVAYMLIALAQRPARPAQPRPAVRADHRGAAGVPVVQRPPGADLHRRLGGAVAGRDAGGHRADHRPDPGPAADRDHLRHRDRCR